MTLTLCGFALSNYVNKVKLVLLEKGLPFNEERVAPGHKPDDLLAASPLGKVPFLRTEHGTLCESSAIVEYLEALAPTPALLPADPWAAAKVRELAVFIDLHLELVARELYPQAFFGGTISDSQKARVRKLLDKNIAGFKRLATFSPYVAGAELHDRRLRGLCHAAAGGAVEQDHLRRRPACRPRRRLEGLWQADCAAAVGTARRCRPQGRSGALVRSGQGKTVASARGRRARGASAGNGSLR